MRPIKIHILFEYGTDSRPHSSSYVRLLRPLRHPHLAKQVEVTSGPRYSGERVDLVIVDRLWRPDINPQLASDLVDEIERDGARLIYSIDDNLLDLAQERSDWPLPHHLQSINIFLERAQAVWVSTDQLKQRLADFHPRIFLVPNALDERLLVGSPGGNGNALSPRDQTVIGFMGTPSHDEDLRLILPALAQVLQRHAGGVAFRLIGGTSTPELLHEIAGIPARVILLDPDESEYPQFLLWFSSRVSWDIAIAPLRETPFTRCKSDIKFLDYSAIGAATLASKVPAYDSTVDPGRTGWLVENSVEAWVDALEEALADQEKRRTLSQNAYRYLITQRTLQYCAGRWWAAIEQSF